MEIRISDANRDIVMSLCKCKEMDEEVIMRQSKSVSSFTISFILTLLWELIAQLAVLNKR